MPEAIEREVRQVAAFPRNLTGALNFSM